ncbi:MAG: hypothetical protein ABL936_10580 [Aestuariivirga sp.]
MNKLPAFQTITHALKAVIQFRSVGARIGLPWILVLTVINFLAHSFSAAPAPADGGMAMMIPGPMDFVVVALSLVIFSSIAVNWHRYILLDEITESEKLFRLDRPVWNYALRTLLIMLFAFAPILVLLKIFGAGVPGLGLFLVVAALLVAAIYIMRMSVALPAIALDRPDFGIPAALQVTKGNNLQFAALLALNSLILLATFLAIGIVLSIVGSVNLAVAKVVAVLLSVPVNLFLSLFSVSLLSSLYGFFVEQRKF